MRSILKKEISAFFSSFTGYIAIGIFLVANAWFMWINPGEWNIIDGGFATIDTLFIIAPWVYLFLIPAITMRSFAEEKKSGTIEILLTQPITDTQLVMGKYLASVVLALFALVPTVIYYISVYQMGNPVGNIDAGGTWGSYIGLFFLAASYVSVGIFTSSLTDNQIISFIIAAVICFFLYTGFDGLSRLEFLKPIDELILSLGINEHYKSMSRGVIDSRDVLYFLSLITLFLGAAGLKLAARKW